MTTSLKAELRNGNTKSEVKQLRAQGLVPGVVYGKAIGAHTIAIDAKELMSLLRSNPHAILEMDIPEAGKHPVMIHEVQRDKINRSFLHIDFHQINMDEPVRTSVTLEFVGEAKGTLEGGLVQTQIHEVEIRCLPSALPESILVDVSNLDLGEALFVRDLVLPEAVELKSHPDDVVVTILAPQKEPAAPEEEIETPAEAANKAAQPVS